MCLLKWWKEKRPADTGRWDQLLKDGHLPCSPWACPPASVCCWWNQPLLGTLVVVTLQLPCVEGEGEEGWEGERRGRDESKHHQRGRMTFVRAQGVLITGGLGLMHRDSEMMKKKKTNETFYSQERKTQPMSFFLAAKWQGLNFEGTIPKHTQSSFRQKETWGIFIALLW